MPRRAPATMSNLGSTIEAADPLSGTSYRVLRKLGHGGSATVYEAEHVTLGKVVAVKVLDADLPHKERWAERVRVEAQALGRLRSPYIVEVSDFGHTVDGRPFLVMERLFGVTLAVELRRQHFLPPELAVDLVQQLLCGLAVAHRAGLVHRDLKLENLFLSDEADGRRVLKILDFGIAKVLPGASGAAPRVLQTQDGDVIGTPRFLAPEQAMGRSVDPRADIYGAGLVLYELLTGKDPFHDVRDLPALLLAHVSRDPPPPSSIAPQSIDPALEGVVLRALSKRPEDRYPSAEALSLALSLALDVSALRARRRSARARGASLPLALFVVATSAALTAALTALALAGP